MSFSKNGYFIIKCQLFLDYNFNFSQGQVRRRITDRVREGVRAEVPNAGETQNSAIFRPRPEFPNLLTEFFSLLRAVSCHLFQPIGTRRSAYFSFVDSAISSLANARSLISS